MTVLEARDRVGGRVEQVPLPDGRLVQLGGEVVGTGHTAYLGLVAELGLTLVPSYVAEPGEITRQVPGSVDVGDWPSWTTDADRASHEKVEDALAQVVRGIDPDDVHAHPDLRRLDRLSVGDWLREVGATPAVIRLKELAALGLADGSIERTSLFAYARKIAVGGGTGLLRLRGLGEPARGRGLGHGRAEDGRRAGRRTAVDARRGDRATGSRVRRAPTRASCSTPTRWCSRSPSGPAARPRDHRRQRGPAHLAAPAAARVGGQVRRGVRRAVLARHRAERAVGVRGRDRLDLAAAGGRAVRAGPARALRRVRRERPGDPHPRGARRRSRRSTATRRDRPLATWTRLWGTDPWTQGYVTNWRPGDVEAVGPLHGTHEPPFYVCGSDQWVAGYMEGAVRTGRAAAAAALHQEAS